MARQRLLHLAEDATKPAVSLPLVETSTVSVEPTASEPEIPRRSARYKAFYRTLAAWKLPFLSHVGYEFSLIGKDQSVGDPDRLKLALDEGATVIAAHACSYGLIIYEKSLPTLRDLVQRYPTVAPSCTTGSVVIH